MPTFVIVRVLPLWLRYRSGIDSIPASQTQIDFEIVELARANGFLHSGTQFWRGEARWLEELHRLLLDKRKRQARETSL